MTQLFKGLERIEEARERLTGYSFMAGLFAGEPDFSLLVMGDESPEHKAAWENFRLRAGAGGDHARADGEDP